MRNASVVARPLAALLVTIAALASARCSSAFEGRPREPTLLTVENRHWSDMELYIERAGAPIRVGRVAGLSTRTFVLNPAVLGAGMDLRLLGRQGVLGQSFPSHALIMPEGTTTRWVIAAEPSMSYVMRR